MPNTNSFLPASDAPFSLEKNNGDGNRVEATLFESVAWVYEHGPCFDGRTKQQKYGGGPMWVTMFLLRGGFR